MGSLGNALLVRLGKWTIPGGGECSTQACQHVDDGLGRNYGVELELVFMAVDACGLYLRRHVGLSVKISKSTRS